MSSLLDRIINDPDIAAMDLSPAQMAYLRDLAGKVEIGGVSGLLEELGDLSGFDWEQEPVTSDIFFTSTEYLCERHVSRIHPVSLQHLIDVCDVYHPKSVIIDTGALGTGKSFRQAHWGLWLAYLIGCLRDPANYLGLGSGTELVIGVTATKQETSADLAYSYMKDMIDNSPWFSRNFPRNRQLEARIELPKGLSVIPESPATNPFIGKNLLAWLGDEVSFLEDTKSSRQEKSIADSMGNIQSRAKRLYDKMFDRILSRFVGRKNYFGGIYMCSSRQYPTDFMENMVTKYKNREMPVDEWRKFYVIEHATWDLKDNVDKKNMFRVAVGDSQTGSFILGEDDLAPQDMEIVWVPELYRAAFESNIEEALRNQAGVATVTVMPLIPRTFVLQRAVAMGEQLRIPLRHPCTKLVTNLTDSDSDIFDVSYLCVRDAEGHLRPRRDPDLPRFIHMDLSKGVGDPAGMAMVYTPHTVSVDAGDIDFMNTRPDMPFVVVELVLSIIPPKGEMMRFDRIRQIPVFLRDRLGFDIQWVTSDQYQSAGLLQALHLKGFRVDDTISLDRAPTAYLQLRSALQENRVAMYDHPTLLRELRMLRWDLKYRKVDHPQYDEKSLNGMGSKDVSDCVAGAMYKLNQMFMEGKCGMDVLPHLISPVPIVNAQMQGDQLMRRVFADDKTSKKDYEELIDMVLSLRSPFNNL
jgi:hypothetical protein